MSEEHNLNTAAVHDAPGSTAEDNTGDEVRSVEEAETVSEPECYSQLREACQQIDVAQIRLIIDKNPQLDLNISGPNQGYTPLLELIAEAALNDFEKQAPECIQFLVDHGADVHAKDERGWTGLHHCARWNNDGSYNIAKVLIALGANPSADQRLTPKSQPGADGATQDPGHVHEQDGCECGQHIGDALKTTFKLATGKELDLKDQDKELDVTPLHHACGYGDNLPIAILLLENGAKVDVNDAVAGTPLFVAAQSGREELCKLLLSKPGGTACLSMHGKTGRLPIHQAAERGSRDLVATLVEAGSLVDPVLEGDAVPDHEKGFTPLLFACKNTGSDQKIDVIQYLLDHGADASKVAEQGQTPLFLSVVAKNVEAAKLLAKHGADPKAAVGPFTDVNALHMAGTAGSADLCRWLVEEVGIDVNSHDNQGYTALISAAGYSNSAETIRMLVSTLSADIEASIYDGRRPLHFAAFKGQEVCARELISLGADKEAVDDSKWTPLHFAARYHHTGVLRLLLESGAQVGKKVEGGPQPKRVDGELFDIEGFTAADLARVIRGGQESVDILVAAGDPLSEVTKDLKDEDLLKEEEGKCCVM